jgi:cyclopropane fatty-acyl-phospholipid synthase-like methyltransferase
MDFNITESGSAAMRNRQPILDQLLTICEDTGSVLELGSGTGVHATFFAQQLPHLTWQASEQAASFEPLRGLDTGGNLLPPILVDMAADTWDVEIHDAIYMANVLHMFPEKQIASLFRKANAVLNEGGRLVVYGPFNTDGAYTGPGNESFDASLKQMHPSFGLRDTAQLKEWAAQAGMTMQPPIRMPADNLLLVFDS